MTPFVAIAIAVTAAVAFVVGHWCGEGAGYQRAHRELADLILEYRRRIGLPVPAAPCRICGQLVPANEAGGHTTCARQPHSGV